tara:strand:+ start:421 stop:705 length:285 start_codon:yes stop_codon:yes gene_type:complete
MPLNKIMLQTAIQAAFRRQATKRGPGKIGVERQLAVDLSTAIDMYVRSGTVMTGTVSTTVAVGFGFTAPYPYGPVPVFTATIGAGVGTGTGVVV